MRPFRTELKKVRTKMSEKMGRLVLYSGCSGVGKGTILKELMKRDESIKLSVSNTTRAPRPDEVDGVDYNFVTKEEFEKVIEEDGYLEYAKYCDNYYGTPIDQVNDMLTQGYNVVLEIEVKGGLQVMENFPDILSIFIVPPSLEVLEERLRGRGTEDESAIKKRLKEVEHEIKYKDRYKHIVVNDKLEDAVEEIYGIITNGK